MCNRFNANYSCCLFLCLILLACDIIDIKSENSVLNDQKQQYIILGILIFLIVLMIFLIILNRNTRNNYQSLDLV